ncbi:GIY-YIG nuclease family protein [Candidatus Latescibacterota bacterium]
MSYNVYVIELDKEFGETKKAKEANPFRNPDRPYVYVGYTFKTPEERFKQHMSGKPGKKGYKLSSSVVYKYGIRLMPDLYAKYNPIRSKKDAMGMEIVLAESLRKRGYTVWQK